MAKKVRIEMKSEGFQAILTSSKVAADIKARTESIAASAGPGFETDTGIGTRHKSARAFGVVAAATVQAMREEAVNKTLTKAIGAGGG